MNLLIKKSIESELTSVNSLLEQAAPNDIIAKLSLEGRRQVLTEKLHEFQQKWRKTAEVILYFGGDPVTGSEMIQTSFAADALNRFQDFVSAVYANRRGELAEAGPLPNMRESQLALAGLPRGSFGFLLQENADSESLVDSNLRNAIQEASNLMGNIIPGEDSEEEVELPAMNPRVFAALKNFISLLSKHNASLAIETDATKISLPKEKVKISGDYIENVTEVTSDDINIIGVFKGVTGIKRRFDFVPEDLEQYGGGLSGRLTKDIDDKFINRMNTEYMDAKCRVLLQRTITKKSDSSRSMVRWILKDIWPAS